MTDKAVLISINPHPTAQIISGEKKVEIRKTKPNLPTPFPCYIYESSGNKFVGIVGNRNPPFRIKGTGRKKVIGEFICDKIITDNAGYRNGVVGYWLLKDGSCLSLDELMEYGQQKTLYGWHISDLVLYDEPKDIKEFNQYNDGSYWVDGSPPLTHPLNRPPQSWCYVEVPSNAD